jgi:N6-adenosine-specific RNA methylase IME4
MDFPTKKYQVIYADPPWSYKNKKTGGSMGSGALQKYNTMELSDICDLPIKSISDKNCCLFLWATTPLLPEAFEVMDLWGFKYKTAIYWRKIMSLGMGFWFRGQVEVCLFGIRGKIPAFHCQKPNFIQSKVRKHSQKPDELLDLINPHIQNLNPKIELFARIKRDGWDCWGDEI